MKTRLGSSKITWPTITWLLNVPVVVKGVYGIHNKLTRINRKITTCNQQDLETLRFTTRGEPAASYRYINRGAHHTSQFRHHPSTSPAKITWLVVDQHLFLNITPNTFTTGTKNNFFGVIGTRVWEITGWRSRFHKKMPILSKESIERTQINKEISKEMPKDPNMCHRWLELEMLGFLLTDLCPKNLSNAHEAWAFSTHSLHPRVVTSWTFHACQGIGNQSLSLSMTVPTPGFIINSMIFIVPPIITCKYVCIWNGVFKGLPCTKSFRPPSEDDEDDESMMIL